MIPKDPAYETRVRESFNRQSHMASRVLRPGRTLTVCQAEVFATEATERTLIATMLSTIIVRPIGHPNAGSA